MTRRHAGAAVLGLAVATALTACGPTGQSVSSKPDHATHAAAQHAASKPKASPRAAATVGDTITLKGQTGETIAVTLTKWTDPVKSGNEYIGPDTGKRWAAAQFSLKNVGDVTYSDSPSNGVQAVDPSGERFDATIADSITAGPLMSDELKLAAGDKALGWIVVEVPKQAKVSKIQFTLDSGFGDQTGEWLVK